MALVLEAVSVSGVVQRVPVAAERIKVTAQQGFTYKLIDDAGAAFDKTIAVKRMRNSLVVDGLPDDKVVELDGFFFNCVPSAPCTFVTENVGGAAPVTPATEPVGALQDGSFLMFGKGEVAKIPTIVPESEFSARPLLIGGGALALVGLAAGGGGKGGGSGGGSTDTTPPDAPVVNSANATKEAKPVISGTAEAGATVLIGIDIDNNGTPDVSYRTVADANGNWSVNLATDPPSALTLPAAGLPEGIVTVTMRAVDAAGNTSAAATTFTLLVDKTAPTTTATISKIVDDQAGGIVGDIAAGGTSNDPTPTLSGTLSTALDAGDRVQILRGNVVAGFATVTGTLWTFTDTLPPGTSATIAYTAQVVDAVGNMAPAGPAFAVTVDTVAPVQPTLAVVAGDNIVNAAEALAPVTLTGTAEAASRVGISWGGKNYTTTATAAGTWQFVVAAADIPGNGIKPIVVTATDAAGNTSASLSQAVSVVTGLPGAPTVSPVAGDNQINATEAAAPVVVSGTADPGNTVTLNLGGIVKPAVTAGADGAWSVTYTATEIATLAQGANLLTVTARDVANNARSTVPPPSIIKDTIAPTQVVTMSDATDDQLPVTGQVANGGRTNDQSPGINVALSAALGAGETLHLYRDGVEVTAAGTSLTATSFRLTDTSGTLASNTTYAYTARVIDAAGNQGALSAAPLSLTIDFTAPAAPTIAAITGDDIISSVERAAGVAVTGTAEAGSSVAVTWNGVTHIGTATGGNYSVTFTSGELPAIGQSTVTATATDAAGNISSASAPRAVTLLGAPATQTATIGAITDDVAPVVGTVASGASTNDGAPALSGSLSAALSAGQTLHLLRNGTDLGTATVNATSWSFTDSTDGFVSGTTYAYTAQVQSTAGNGAVSSAYSMVFDNTAPAAPTIGVIAGDDIVSTVERAAVGGVAVTGTAEAGSSVAVTWNGVTHTATATGGNYSVSFTSAELPASGASSVTATATDAAGNVSSATAPHAVTIQAAAPTQTVSITSITDNVAPQIGTVASGGSTNDNAPQLSGTLSAALLAGQTLHVLRNGADLGAATVGAGTWTFTDNSGGLANGSTYVYSALVESSAGNGTPSTTYSMVFDNTAPTAPTIGVVAGDDIVTAVERAAVGGVAVTGTAEAGSSVAVTWNGVTHTATATGGNYSVSFTSAELPASGASSVTATATDAAGNVSSATAPHAVTIQAAAPTQIATITAIIDDFAPQLGTVASGGSTNDGTPGVSGTLSAALTLGQTLHLLRNGTDVGTATVNTTNWSFIDSTDGFVSGTTYAYTARVQDLSSNGPTSTAYSMVFDNTAPSIPTISPVTGDDVLTSVERAGSVAVTGNAETGSVVAVTWNGFTHSATAAGGSYSVTFASGELPASGATTITATSTDAAGNASVSAPHSVTSLPPPGGTDPAVLSFKRADTVTTSNSSTLTLTDLLASGDPTLLGTDPSAASGTTAATATAYPTYNAATGSFAVQLSIDSTITPHVV